MNVRDAVLDDEPWILETLAELGLEDPGFRPYRYVVVTNEEGQRVGLGRLAEREGGAVELVNVGGVGDRPTLATAHAARGLVERALADHDPVLVAAESPRAFEAVGFREADPAAVPLEADDGETPLRWVPPEEREERDEEDSEDAGAGRSRAKYDPEEASRRTSQEEPSESGAEPAPAADDSTEAAARRQGIDPDAVETKYATGSDDEPRRTKYET